MTPRMNPEAIVRVLFQLMEAKGCETKRYTVNQASDPTSASLQKCRAWIFQKEHNNEYHGEYPSEIEISVRCIWTTDIHIKFLDPEDAKKYGDFKLWMDDVDGLHYEGSPNRVINFLLNLVLNGVWEKTPPWLVEPDPMGCLADYE